jgi:Zn-dependent protease
MGDLTLQHVVLRLCAGLLVVSVNGGTIGWAAGILGDRGPRDDDRLGFSPFRHVDLVGSLLLILFTYGWIAPVAVDPHRLRPGRAGLVAIVAGTSCATLALIPLLLLVRPFVLNLLPDTAAATFFVFTETVGQLCVSFTLFNLLPLPPLLGQHLLITVWPQKRLAIQRAGPYCAILLVVLVVIGVVARLLAPAEAVVRHAVLNT